MYYGSIARIGFNFNRASVLLDHGQGYCEAESAPASRAFRGEERIEYLSDNVFGNAGSVVGKCHADLIAGASDGNIQLALFARGRDGLFGVGQNIQEHLHEKLSIAVHGRQIVGRHQFHANTLLLKVWPLGF